jgi:mRNA interferase HigB
MHIISKRSFIKASARHPNQHDALLKMYKTLSSNNVRFESPDEMRRVFPSLDNFSYVDKWWVLNIGGNHIRMIACILFSQNLVFVKHIVTYTEYDQLCERYRRGDLP